MTVQLNLTKNWTSKRGLTLFLAIYFYLIYQGDRGKRVHYTLYLKSDLKIQEFGTWHNTRSTGGFRNVKKRLS